MNINVLIKSCSIRLKIVVDVDFPIYPNPVYTDRNPMKSTPRLNKVHAPHPRLANSRKSNNARSTHQGATSWLGQPKNLPMQGLRARCWQPSSVNRAAVLLTSRCRPKADVTRIRVCIRLSPDVLDHFKASGDAWPTRIDAALGQYVAERPNSL